MDKKAGFHRVVEGSMTSNLFHTETVESANNVNRGNQSMKKSILILFAALALAGCGQNQGGTSDQTGTTTGTSSSTTSSSDTS
ncbi:MAG TPA: lipoprotein, partial [Patescibacteria group bacterium]|nr:lipoprotein [Patescibacteria group bacterium]